VATALDMIKRAMRLARVIGKGETLDDDEAQDGLTALNAMLDSWATESLFVFRIQEDSFTWGSGSQSRTVGAAGNFVMSRPAKIDPSTYFVVDSISYPVLLIDSDAWAAIPDKTTTSQFPFWLYPEYGVSVVTLYAYPTPSASVTIKLRSWSLLQSFAALTTDLSLPLGYKRAIEYSLAEEYGPEFGKQIPDDVRRIATAARKNIKRINATAPVMTSEVGYMNRRIQGNVYADIPN
jgi:hypothetical protein